MSLKAYYTQNVIEAGCDEAGRGCLAGPVFAAAVVLPGEFDHPLLNDSKMLSGKKRYLLRKDIEKYAVAWSVAQVNNIEIDEINILRASFKAMHKAIGALKVQPEHLIIDGNRFHPFDSIPHTCIIKGDSRYQSIAAASILAKTYRDDFMISIHEEFPHFNWKANKGYPTKEHREGILEHGISPYHRRSFSLINTQLKCWNE